jgi:hypothetical protein
VVGARLMKAADLSDRQCTVIDISEAGARLRVEDPQFVKPQFQLKFDRTSPGRACKVAWKKGDVIGIKFV